MPDLEPNTRDEMLWSGEDVEPITRREMYIRHLYDETQVIPDKPITREEMFILKAGEELHDVTIEQLNVSENGTYSESGKAYSPVIVNVPTYSLESLSVTENGTYTAPSGKAYNEVDVNVPLPENAYLLKDFENVPSDIVTFNDGANLPMPSLKVSIEPVQSGSGDPSPSNVRPISGWTEANVTDCGKNFFDIDAEHTVVSGSATYQYDLTLEPNTTYTMSSNVPQENPASLYFNGGATNVNGVWDGMPRTFTSDSQGKLIVYVRYTSTQGGIDLYTAVKNGTYYIQLEEGSTATEYTPYNGHTYTIPFTDSQGNTVTVYGGECDVVNGGNGNKTTLVSVDLATVEATYNSGWNCWVIQATALPNAKLVDSNNTPTNAMTDRFKVVKASGYGTSHESGTIAQNTSGIWFIDNGSTTELSGQLVYELATPSTFISQPTAIKSLEGSNNVWADCGQILEGEYFSESEEE